uniref:Uncharacterized protein n=1 Tax=Ditylenchus dipsaci TaxID=166011 RepID=A0A915ELD0_9BILA
MHETTSQTIMSDSPTKGHAVLYLKQTHEQPKQDVLVHKAYNGPLESLGLAGDLDTKHLEEFVQIQPKQLAIENEISEVVEALQTSKPDAILHLKHSITQKSMEQVTDQSAKVSGTKALHRKKAKKQSNKQAVLIPEQPTESEQKWSETQLDLEEHKLTATLHLKQAPKEIQDSESAGTPTASKLATRQEQTDQQPFTGQLSELSRSDGHETQPWEGLVQPYHSGQSWQAVHKQNTEIVPISKPTATLHLKQPIHDVSSKVVKPEDVLESTGYGVLHFKKTNKQLKMSSEEYVGSLGSLTKAGSLDKQP